MSRPPPRAGVVNPAPPDISCRTFPRKKAEACRHDMGRANAMSDLNRLTQMVVDRAAALALYARQWLGDDASSAQDVVQDALTALLMQRQPPSDPVAWMYRAVRNAAIDHA